MNSTVKLIVCCGFLSINSSNSMAGGMTEVTGSVTYRERIALTPGSMVEVKLLDVSLQDVLARVVAEQTIEVTHQVPIPFELVYDPDEIDQRMSYAVRATIFHGEKMLFTTDRSYPVLTRGKGARVDLVLVRVGGQKARVAKVDLVDTRWILQILDDQAVMLAEKQRVPFIHLRQDGERSIAFGFAGCNNFNGGYEIESGTLRFGNLASTLMACPEMELERRFYDALERVDRYSIDGSELVLYAAGTELARFEASFD